MQFLFPCSCCSALMPVSIYLLSASCQFPESSLTIILLTILDLIYVYCKLITSVYKNASSLVLHIPNLKGCCSLIITKSDIMVMSEVHTQYTHTLFIVFRILPTHTRSPLELLQWAAVVVASHSHSDPLHASDWNYSRHGLD